MDSIFIEANRRIEQSRIQLFVACYHEKTLQTTLLMFYLSANGQTIYLKDKLNGLVIASVAGIVIENI